MKPGRRIIILSALTFLLLVVFLDFLHSHHHDHEHHCEHQDCPVFLFTRTLNFSPGIWGVNLSVAPVMLFRYFILRDEAYDSRPLLNTYWGRGPPGSA